MSSYSCRPALPADFPVVATFPETADELFAMFPSGVYPLQAEQLEEAAGKRWCPTVVCDKAGAVVGYANIYGYKPGESGFVGNVIIAKPHRGSGAAACLIGEMIRQAGEALQLPRLELVCHHVNPRALLFYKKMGFAPFDLTKMKGPDGQTIVGIQMFMALPPAEAEAKRD